MTTLLSCFEVALGLNLVNLAKSKVALAGNVSNVGRLACILGCEISRLSMKYLGLPLGALFK